MITIYSVSDFDLFYWIYFTEIKTILIILKAFHTINRSKGVNGGSWTLYNVINLGQSKTLNPEHRKRKADFIDGARTEQTPTQLDTMTIKQSSVNFLILLTIIMRKFWYKCMKKFLNRLYLA